MCILDGVRRARCRGRQAGLSLIELVMFIVIVTVGLAAMLLVFNATTQKSTDPQIRKQMLAAAEALLEEVELKAFTICDPDDPNSATANAAADCTGGAGGANDENSGGGNLSFEAGETRTTFDNVSDYNGLSLATVSDINGTATLSGYSANVSVVRESIGGVPADASLRITVTITRAGGGSLSLTGYRMRYAPRAVP
jgi:MSHA pilin protein MshD